jgi:hypothetical protein
LPKTNLPNLDIALSDRRQTLALKWGEKHPYLLQLAGMYLWEAKRFDKSDDWAKAEFEQARKNTMGRRFGRKWWLPLWWIFHDFPIGVSRLIKSIGKRLSAINEWGMGFFVLLFIALAVFGRGSFLQVIDGVRQFVCSSLGSALGKFCQ